MHILIIRFTGSQVPSAKKRNNRNNTKIHCYNNFVLIVESKSKGMGNEEEEEKIAMGFRLI